MPETTLKATLEIEANTNKAQRQLKEFVDKAQKEGTPIIPVLEKLRQDKRRSPYFIRTTESYLKQAKETRKLTANTMRDLYGKANREVVNEAVVLDLQEALGKKIEEYETKNDWIYKATQSVEARKKRQETEKEREENKRIRQNNSYLQTAAMTGYLLKLIPGGTRGMQSLGGYVIKIAHLLHKYTKPEGIKKRYIALGKLLERRGISFGGFANLGIGLGAAYLAYKGISSISRYVGNRAIESIPYSRAMQIGVGTDLGSRMSAFQSAGFGKQRALAWRANLQSQIGNVKLGMGNAGILMALGLSALDDKNRFEKQIIERLKTLPQDEAVALGQQIGMTYQEVASARLGLLDNKSFGYSEELMNRYNNLGNALNTFVAFFETLKYNIIGSGVFSIIDAIKNTVGGGYASKITAMFPNLIVNVDKEGKAGVQGPIESNEIDWSSTFQQEGVQ